MYRDTVHVSSARSVVPLDAVALWRVMKMPRPWDDVEGFTIHGIVCA